MAKDELKILVPDEVINTIQGDVTVKPFKFTQFPKVIKTISEYASLISSAIAVSNENEILNIATALVSDDSEGIFDLIAMAIGKDREFLDSLEAEDGFNILVKVVELNIDFFVKTLAPKLGELTVKIGGITPQGGEEQLVS